MYYYYNGEQVFISKPNYTALPSLGHTRMNGSAPSCYNRPAVTNRQPPMEMLPQAVVGTAATGGAAVYMICVVA